MMEKRGSSVVKNCESFFKTYKQESVTSNCNAIIYKYFTENNMWRQTATILSKT